MKLWPETLEYAPIVIAPYIRYETLKRTIEALQRNTLASQSALFLFSDAPGKPEHVSKVQKVREYLRAITGFKHVLIVERERNFGAIKNYTDAFEAILERYSRYINIEDDIVTSPCFLQYMNDALRFYKDNPAIIGISAFCPPFPLQCADETFFLHYFQPWGNAMWKEWRRDAMRMNAQEALEALQRRKLVKRFNEYSSFIISNTRMLKMTAKKRINAMDVCISANVFLSGRYVLFPARSLTNHIGFGDGVHCTVATNDYETELSTTPIHIMPREVAEDPAIVKQFHAWLLIAHIKLLLRYLLSLGPIRQYLRRRSKNSEF